MLIRFVRSVCIAVVRIFYRQIRVVGDEHVPSDGPVLVVANHPNGLIDPVLIRMALGRSVGFMAKSTLFENPVGRVAMDAFDAVPVYRSRDGEDTSKNRETFEGCRRRFVEGGWIVMFPEGVSHSEPRLQPLKTGAARIALAAEEASDFSLGLRILPVGFVYEDKGVFRSRVALRVGTPIAAASVREAYERDERAGSRELTDRIAETLADVVLEADSRELWHGFLAVARWTHPPATRDVAACEAHARRLADAWTTMLSEDPETAEELLEETRHFVRMLESVGVENPLALEEAESPPPARMAAATIRTVLLAPFALVGVMLGWLPYRLIRPAAEKIAGGESDLVSTIKALMGLVFMPLTYLAQATLVGWFFGWTWALAVLVAGPVTGFLALRFFERISLRRDALRGYWLRTTRAHIVEAIEGRRRELAGRIERALA